ncbi:murein hydrolase activator EnvC family protein [Legionella pneumophila]|uniref:Peptidase, M23/M37 family n=1 Tax=Legionella pneumophila subsp. pascullei TaxID=91890 RepID=A0AAX2IX29_LEGPN|nr:peptidoglycan DD-metalloendopeptidase family protein [Legionella pneumophila]AMP91552.1 peptidase M24 [Legionella pneumophila subsp. pascullei]AMP94538.1 peptidase M24 [Legionella pneumophila subsp. pascullei]SQG89344.1 peptidase, M23/M37 family [Legionella pneumophila subsp. pascullei]VEH04525.1 peptidase, M23/M37 family [Legionella pneumophila subsp. pascullei]HDU8261121.1 peptidoglycan DD-metalloendopeptidase family protein [Legionella pneumophila]
MRMPSLPNCLSSTRLGLALVLILFFCNGLEAKTAPNSITQTQAKLKQLDAKINKLKQVLANAQDKRIVLNQELGSTEKQIGEGIRKLRIIQANMSAKEKSIAELQGKISHLNERLLAQQEMLANHVRARYQMGEYQPLKWLINQDEPFKINRILTYYQYIIRSRQQLIDEIARTRQNLNDSKTKLGNELAENKQLQFKLSQNQQQLEQNKRYHSTLIQSIDNDIQNNQQSLKDFQKDRDNLSHLLKSLSQQSVIQSGRPITGMRKKLPLPIQTTHRSLRRMNQGVTFFADEGSIVTAVYPGKVVFSDWLKGYGLLLIIDHGHGFMTLYAHNQSLFKRKGQIVQQNEQIASVGHTGGIKQNGLYFEIRQRGKAVNPLDWLS